MSSIKPFVLHAHGTGPNPYKVAIVLELLSLPYTVKLWDFGPEGLKGPAFLKINPNGRVPALEDPNTGIISWESMACINYLVRVYDKENKLGPKDSEQARVEYDTWTSFLISTLGPMQGQVNWFKHFNGTENENALKRYEGQFYNYISVLEGQLKKSDGASVLESGFSAVDAHFIPWVRGHGFAGLTLDNHPLVKKWLEKSLALKEVQAAYEKIPAGEKA